MAIPTFLSQTPRFLEILINDVQGIIDNLYTELVTNGGWSCTQGGSGQSPTTFKSPARSDGISFTIQFTRISATRIAYVVKDHLGLQVNNATDTRQDLGAGMTYVRLYTNPFYVIVDSDNPASGECWGCGVADRAPEPIDKPRPVYWASRGPRDNAGSTGYNSWRNMWILPVGGSAYAAGGSYIIDLRCPAATTYADKFTCAGTMLFMPVELIDGPWLLGRMFNLLYTESSQPNQAEFTVPFDSQTAGTFRILGWGISQAAKLAARVS